MKKSESFFLKRIEPLIIPIAFLIIIGTITYAALTQHRRDVDNGLKNGYGITFLNLSEEELYGFHLGFYSADGTSYMQSQISTRIKTGSFDTTFMVNEGNVNGIDTSQISVDVGIYLEQGVSEGNAHRQPVTNNAPIAPSGRGTLLSTDTGDINVIVVYGSYEDGFTIDFGTPEDFGIDIYKRNT